MFRTSLERWGYILLFERLYHFNGRVTTITHKVDGSTSRGLYVDL